MSGYTGTDAFDVITSSGFYDITAAGAEGGNSTHFGGHTVDGGLGASVSGYVYLQAGAVLEIIAGGEGQSANFSGGGGGGSFVIEVYDGTNALYNVLMAAGGGGGAGAGSNGIGGGGGSIQTGGHGGGFSGGTGGYENIYPEPGVGGYEGGGGGGFTGGTGGTVNTAGGSGSDVGSNSSTVGFGGGAGGGYPVNPGDSANGGFGGGGGGGFRGGGGGGGFGGGGGGGWGFASSGGGGGGSYVIASNGGHATTHVTITGGDNTGNGDVTITQVVCYMRGTHILTPTGQVRIEDLSIGDLVVTRDHGAQPVKWLGQRQLDCTRHPDPRAVWPVRVRRDAFNQGVPMRDLYLSPVHSVFVDGVLIQAQNLINGATVTQEPRARVEYWHVELEAHEILFAEDLPAESYLDTGNRNAFVNGGAYMEIHPDFKPKHWAETCVPLVLDGPEIANARAGLLARAGTLGHQLTQEDDLHIIADGKRIEPVGLGAMRLGFMLPENRQNIRLHSNVFTPAHRDPASDDWRVLGICVSRLQLDGVDIALDDATLRAADWHGVERAPGSPDQRWTAGAVTLPQNTRLVVVDLASPGYYWTGEADNAVALFG